MLYLLSSCISLVGVEGEGLEGCCIVQKMRNGQVISILIPGTTLIYVIFRYCILKTTFSHLFKKNSVQYCNLGWRREDT